MAKMKRGTVSWLTSVMLVMVLLLAACSSGNNNAGSSSTPPPKSETPKPSESAKPSESKPPEIVKIQVTLWDRANQPEGAAGLKDNVIIKWVNEQLAPLGVEAEYLQIPRGEAGEKLNVQMASGDAPDIIMTYDLNIMENFAKQGALHELDKWLDEYGENLKENNAAALAVTGTVDGKRYAIPAVRSAKHGGANAMIRKDWLDKLGLPVPTTNEELYEALKQFKEKDPGGIGKENVVPYGLNALNGAGQYTFLYGTMSGFGIKSEGPGLNGVYMQTGNIINGQFTSSIAMPEGKEYFRWLNKLYNEGLISKEFATDINSVRFKQDLANGYIGYFESNNPPSHETVQARKTAKTEVNYVTVYPPKDQNGNQYFGKTADYGMFIMIPRSSSEKEAIAAMKYLNWMAQIDVIKALNWGLEGVHYNFIDGVRTPIDPELNKKDLWVFGGGDLEIVQQGVEEYTTREALINAVKANPDYATAELQEEYATKVLDFQKMVREHGYILPPISGDRPVDAQKGANLATIVQEGISKSIIAKTANFDAEYDKMVNAWKASGGEDWDKELSALIASKGITGVTKAFQ